MGVIVESMLFADRFKVSSLGLGVIRFVSPHRTLQIAYQGRPCARVLLLVAPATISSYLVSLTLPPTRLSMSWPVALPIG